MSSYFIFLWEKALRNALKQFHVHRVARSFQQKAEQIGFLNVKVKKEHGVKHSPLQLSNNPGFSGSTTTPNILELIEAITCLDPWWQLLVMKSPHLHPTASQHEHASSHYYYQLPVLSYYYYHYSFLGLTICPTIQFVKNMHYNPWFASFERLWISKCLKEQALRANKNSVIIIIIR